MNPQYKDAELALRYPVTLLPLLTYDHSPPYKDHGITALRCYRITLRFLNHFGYLQRPSVMLGTITVTY